MKCINQLVIGSLAVALLSGCSQSSSERRQAADNFEYLKAKSAPTLATPADQTLETYPNYDIPQGSYTGSLGKDVDIRPPQKILELIPGARIEENNGMVTLWLLTEEERDKVWQTALTMMKEQNITISAQDEQRIETDWITWDDDDEKISSRFEITRFDNNARYGFQISLTGWREGNKVTSVDALNRSRYNTQMTNLVMSRYDQQVREEAEKQALALVKVIPLSMGKDRSGLPIIIARAQYNVFWQRVPSLLPQMGFSISERNQSQGTIEASFVSPDSDFWQEIGTKPLSYPAEKYTFLLGDLGNRTSINVTDNTGKPVTEEMLQELIPVLVSMMENNN